MFRYSYQIELIWWNEIEPNKEPDTKLVNVVQFTSMQKVFDYYEEMKQWYDPAPNDFRVYVDRNKIK